MTEETETVEQTEQTEQVDDQTTETVKEETVPMSRFDEVNTKVSGLEETNAAQAQQLALLKANANTNQQQAPQAFDIMAHVGLDVNDEEAIPTAKQLKQINDYRQGQLDSRLSEIAFKLDNPDFAQVVGTEEQMRSGQFAKPLADAIRDNPALLATIKGSSNPKVAAYGLAKLYAKQQDEAATKEKDATKITKKDAKNAIDEAVENANQVKSSSTVAGGAALSEDGRYANMSDEEFIKLAHSQGATI